MSLCKGCKTAVSIERESPNSFSVEVGFHSGSALKPTSFVIVMDVLTDDVRNGSLLELLCADSLALWEESLDAGKARKMEKGIRRNGSMAEFQEDKRNIVTVSQESLYSEGGCLSCLWWTSWFNSIQCIKYQTQVNHNSSDVPQQVILLLHQDIFVSVGCVWVITAQ